MYKNVEWVQCFHVCGMQRDESAGVDEERARERIMQGGTMTSLDYGIDPVFGRSMPLPGVVGFKRRCMDEDQSFDMDIMHDDYRSSKRYLSSTLASQLESLKLMESPAVRVPHQQEPFPVEEYSQTTRGKHVNEMEDGTNMGTPEVGPDGQPTSACRAMVLYKPVQFSVDKKFLNNSVQRDRILDNWIKYGDERQYAIVPYQAPMRPLESWNRKPVATIVEEDDSMMS